MKITSIMFALLLSLTACSAQRAENQQADEQKNAKSQMQNKSVETQSKKFVLVELFTSEGCSSCPPADKVLARLKNEQPVENVEIVPLALHVDYWNYLGWRDQFSSADYSARQNGYAEKFKLEAIYTPQMVVDGSAQFTGSQFGTAINSIRESAKTKKAEVLMVSENDALKIDISDLPVHDAAYVWFVITEDDLKTDVRRGENSGKKLPHTAVVREMKMLDTLAENAKNYSKVQTLSLLPEWKKENLSLIIFVQGQNSKNIFAVGKKRLV